MQEEASRLVFDDVNVAPIVAEGIQLMQSKFKEHAEEILQTKIVSPAEVKEKIDRWKKAIEAEIDSLFNVKKALVGGEGGNEKDDERPRSSSITFQSHLHLETWWQQPSKKRKRKLCCSSGNS